MKRPCRPIDDEVDAIRLVRSAFAETEAVVRKRDGEETSQLDDRRHLCPRQLGRSLRSYRLVQLADTVPSGEQMSQQAIGELRATACTNNIDTVVAAEPTTGTAASPYHHPCGSQGAVLKVGGDQRMCEERRAVGDKGGHGVQQLQGGVLAGAEGLSNALRREH